MMKYRKKPVVIDAVKWTGGNIQDIDAMAPSREYYMDAATGNLIIHTLEGDHRANIGDWIIKGVKGELYPCRWDIFEETYEPVTP